MPLRLIIGIIGAVAIILLIIYLRAGDVTASIDVSCDDFTKQGNTITKDIKIDVWEDLLVVNLCSNPTTGFQWELTGVSSSNKVGEVLTQKSNEYVAPETKDIVGASGQEVWTFKVARVGSSNVTMEYSQPWEGGEKAVRKFILSAHVK